MDIKLHREAPVFKRCCFCLPLRRGLIAWGYGRLILDILVILYLFLLAAIVAAFSNSLQHASSYIAVLSFFIIDVVFTILLVVAGHKKNSKLLRISYIYSIAWVILVLAFGVYGAVADINRIYSTWKYYKSHKFLIFELGMNCALLFTIIFVQVYVILLTRSEAVKLQIQSLEMQFVNNAAEAEALCVSAEQGCTENKFTDSALHEPTQNGKRSNIV